MNPTGINSSPTWSPRIGEKRGEWASNSDRFSAEPTLGRAQAVFLPQQVLPWGAEEKGKEDGGGGARGTTIFKSEHDFKKRFQGTSADINSIRDKKAKELLKLTENWHGRRGTAFGSAHSYREPRKRETVQARSSSSKDMSDQLFDLLDLIDEKRPEQGRKIKEGQAEQARQGEEVSFLEQLEEGQKKEKEEKEERRGEDPMLKQMPQKERLSSSLLQYLVLQVCNGNDQICMTSTDSLSMTEVQDDFVARSDEREVQKVGDQEKRPTGEEGGNIKESFGSVLKEDEEQEEKITESQWEEVKEKEVVAEKQEEDDERKEESQKINGEEDNGSLLSKIEYLTNQNLYLMRGMSLF